MIGGMFGSLMADQTGSPFVLMTELGWSPQAYGLLILFNVFGFLSGSLTAARLAPQASTPHPAGRAAAGGRAAGGAGSSSTPGPR